MMTKVDSASKHYRLMAETSEFGRTSTSIYIYIPIYIEDIVYGIGNSYFLLWLFWMVSIATIRFSNFISLDLPYIK